MIINKELLATWESLRSPNDSKKMMAIYKEQYPNEYVYVEKFNLPLRVGKCNDKVFKVIADYYQQKQELINQYI